MQGASSCPAVFISDVMNKAGNGAKVLNPSPANPFRLFISREWAYMAAPGGAQMQSKKKFRLYQYYY